MAIREDLMLAAYAVACGFTLRIDGGKRRFHPDSFIAGIPHDGLSFERDDVHVWSTARGWRVAKVEGGRFPRPVDSDFHRTLYPALERARSFGTVADLEARGFVRVPTEEGAFLQFQGSRVARHVNVANRRGLGLPTDSDWSVEVWDCSDEADTDIQDTDKGEREDAESLSVAVDTALARLAQIEAGE